MVCGVVCCGMLCMGWLVGQNMVSDVFVMLVISMWLGVCVIVIGSFVFISVVCGVMLYVQNIGSLLLWIVIVLLNLGVFKLLMFSFCGWLIWIGVLCMFGNWFVICIVWIVLVLCSGCIDMISWLLKIFVWWFVIDVWYIGMLCFFLMWCSLIFLWVSMFLNENEQLIVNMMKLFCYSVLSDLMCLVSWLFLQMLQFGMLV